MEDRNDTSTHHGDEEDDESIVERIKDILP